jgi:hypothetical protein
MGGLRTHETVLSIRLNKTASNQVASVKITPQGTRLPNRFFPCSATAANNDFGYYQWLLFKTATMLFRNCVISDLTSWV